MQSKNKLKNENLQTKKIPSNGDKALAGITLSDWKKEKNRLEILNEVGLAVTQMLDLDQILQYTENVIVKRLGITESLIYLKNGETENYQLWHSYGIEDRMTQEIRNKQTGGNGFCEGYC